MSSSKSGDAQNNAPDLNLLGEQVTIHPAGYVQSPVGGHEGYEQHLVGHMARFRKSPFDFLREVNLYASGGGWEAYEDVIGQPTFYNGFTEKMKAKVMSQPSLKRRIETLACHRGKVEDEEGLFGEDDGRLRRKLKRQKAIEGSLQEVAGKMLDEMICKMESKWFIRGACYLCMQLLTRAYHQGGDAYFRKVPHFRELGLTSDRNTCL